MPATLKPKLQSDMKSSMKGGDKARLSIIRLMLAAIKQIIESLALSPPFIDDFMSDCSLGLSVAGIVRLKQC